jgi:S-disulfanyl-L-cysteine oxidoreductase SoxD
MHTHKITLASAIILACLNSAHPQTRYGIGRVATEAEIAGWNIDVDREGHNLPSTSGTVPRGQQVFAEQCASCHGDKGQGGLGDRLAGGASTLNTSNPIKTVGSYWPYATTLFDYVRRAMPQTNPQSLSNEDVYSVTGYVLYLNGLLGANARVDADTLVSVKMPNRNMFVDDPRPDVKDPECMAHC